MASTAAKLLTILSNSGIVYQLRADFPVDATAPMGQSPITYNAEVGDLLLYQQDGVAEWLIDDGVLQVSAASTTPSSVYMIMQSMARAAGLALKTRVAQNPNGTEGVVTASPLVGWTTPSAIGISTITGVWWYTSNSAFVTTDKNNDSIFLLPTPVINTFYEIVVILRASGSFLLIDGVLEAVLNNGSDVSVRPLVLTFSAQRHTPKIDKARVGQLGPIWQSDATVASALLPGARSVNDSFSHQANSVLLDFVLTTLPSAGAIEVDICRQDANNCWRISVDSSGNYRLYEVVAGTPTLRLYTTAQAGDRLVCALNGTRARLTRVRSDASATTGLYASVSTFTTQTAGLVKSLGTGGAISDLRAYPMQLTGELKAWVDAL